jgi:crossover junction endodeoxyribonuclease RuvC
MDIILGIDPGSRFTGYGIISVDGNIISHLDHGTIKTSNKDFSARLFHIYNELNHIITKHQPNQAAIETVFFAKNAQSALKLGQARGAAITAIASKALPLHEYSPKQIKQSITGTGAADKQQVQQMVKMLLKLNDIPQSDAADALACAVCHCHHHTVLARIKNATTTAGNGA